MAAHIPTRDEAFALLQKFNSDESLIRHALAVEGVMRYFAQKYGEDSEKWGIIGLVHDLDYQQYPNQHCTKTAEILTAHRWPEDYVRAVVSHGWGICSDIEPLEKMEKVLYAVDELTGLVAATALVRPSRSVLDMESKSIKKKWKDKSFAAGVNRDVIQKGAEMLGMELADLFQETIAGMRNIAQEIGLKGDVQME
ncbi:MAG: HDIG domain-containing protein [Sedimentisphaerales bacterium]|nr:HDIG domain-containing protein [Sedimentisphaerales bacterium]